MEEMDEIFNKLSEYSQMQELVEFEGKEQSFISWLQPMILELEKEKKKLIQASNKSEKSKRIGNQINIIIGIVCILFSIGYINRVKYNYNLELEEIKHNYNLELEKFKQNFKHVNEIENEYMDKINEYVDVTNVSLTSDAVSFSAKLSVNNDNYGIALTETSKYIVMTNDEKVFEYDVFGKHLTYNRSANMLGKGIRNSGTLAQAKFYGINKDDISYIKLTDIELFKLDSARTLVKENLEIELYNKTINN